MASGGFFGSKAMGENSSVCGNAQVFAPVNTSVRSVLNGSGDLFP